MRELPFKSIYQIFFFFMNVTVLNYYLIITIASALIWRCHHILIKVYSFKYILLTMAIKVFLKMTSPKGVYEKKG